MKKKITPVIICILLVLCLFPTVSLAATETIDLAGVASGSTVTIHTGDAATIIDSAPAERTNIWIECEAGVSVTLSGVNINNSATTGACPLSFTGSGNTLTLMAGTTNTLRAGQYEPAVRAEDSTELTIDGTGTLFATGGPAGAGIGGGSNSDGGNITIESGIITSSGTNAAGIGGGNIGGFNMVTINGGNVTATGYDNAAGIGGAIGHSGAITITGGNVTATAATTVGAMTGAGIGSGVLGNGGTISISGGNVTASSTNGGAGIGCGCLGSGATVQITGGVISVTSSGCDIGSGGSLSVDGAASLTLNSAGTNSAVTLGDCYITGAGAGSLAGVYIDGDKFGDVADEIVIDVGGTYGMTSGFGFDGTTFTLPMTNYKYLLVGSTTSRRVVVSPGVTTDVILFGASIQPSSGCAFDMTGANVDMELCGTSTLKSANGAGLMVPAGASVSISGDGSLAAQGGDWYSGIGGGGSITINGGTINATGGGCAAGIGGFYGQPLSCGTITIKGGNITATGGSNTGFNTGAGIGGGSECGSGGTIRIEGGTVTATGKEYSAGIGGGYNCDGGNITITGGTVIAEGGALGGPGIGGGQGRSSGIITIEDGDINATGGTGSAGIGCGFGGSGGTITIKGGNVTANGGGAGAGIGNARGAGSGAVTEINISGGDITATGGTESNDGLGGAGIGSSFNAGSANIGITGGSVTATGGGRSAGIGGGQASSGGTIAISGGTVYATGSNNGGAGIGGGCYSMNTGGGAGDITISGGIIYADGQGAAADIGNGDGGSGGSLGISGGAAVFLRNKSCLAPVTTTHSGYPYSGGTSTVWGFSIPSSWAADFSAWLRLYTLTYNVNNGSGTAPSPVTQLYNKTEAVADDSGLTRTGYGFGGWDTKADGTGTAYAAGSTFTFTANSTLYAKWAANTYTVEYNANGGAGTTASSSHVYDAAKALTASGFTRAGYTFAGWAESADGAAVYTDSQSVKNLASADGAKLTLYAKWTANTYTVEYNANGGAGTTASSSHVYDAAKALTANGFTRAGYTFAGWAESVGGAAVYTDGQSVRNLASADGAKLTLYAKWTAVPQLTSSAADGKIYTGGRITLTPNIPGGTWSFDASMLSRNGNIFTALKTGTVRVTYTVEGQSTYYDITAQAAQLPKTGQDGTLIWLLAAAGAAALAAAVLAVKYKRAK